MDVHPESLRSTRRAAVCRASRLKCGAVFSDDQRAIKRERGSEIAETLQQHIVSRAVEADAAELFGRSSSLGDLAGASRFAGVLKRIWDRTVFQSLRCL